MIYSLLIILFHFRSQRNDYTPNYLASMSTTSGLGSNYTTNTTSILSNASSLSSHVNTSSPCRKCESSSDENMFCLPKYPPPFRMQAVQALRARETDIYYNNYGMEHQRSDNTPELSRASSHSRERVPQMGLSATGHRRTMSNNLSATPPPPPIIEPPLIMSKNPFLSMIQPTPTRQRFDYRTYENVPFSPVHNQLYLDPNEKDTLGTLGRSSLRRRPEDSFTTDNQSYSSNGSRVKFSPTPSS